MKSTSLFPIISIFILCNYSCQENKSKGLIELEKLPKLAEVGSINLTLDSVTVGQSEKSIEYFTENGKEYLAKFNKPDQSIKVFSLESGKVTKSIQMSTTGPNALVDFDGVPSNFKYISPDSILLYNDVKSEIVLINSQAEINNNWKITTWSDSVSYPMFSLGTYAKMIVNKQRLILPGDISMYDRLVPPVSVIQLNDKKTPQKQIPEDFKIYTQYPLYEIGSAHLFEASSTVNSKGEIIISYAMDHRVLILDKDLKASYKELKNPRLEGIKGYGKNMKKVDINSEEYDNYLFTTGLYYAILYDKYRNIYYRIAKLPFPIAEFQELRKTGAYKPPKYSIIAYNEDFQPIGELVFDIEFYISRMIFVSEKGLNIGKTTNNEDLLTFTTFALDK